MTSRSAATAGQQELRGAHYEWLYVLRGQLRVRLGDHDFTMRAGEAAEFDCRVPHWFGAAGHGSVEVLSLFGKQGERIHLRTPATRRGQVG